VEEADLPLSPLLSYNQVRRLIPQVAANGARLQQTSVPTLILLLFRHAWLLFVLTTCAQGAIWWRTSKPRIAQDPSLGPEYRNLIRSFLIYGNLPWLVMGAGIISGAVPSTLHYFNPRNGPFVITFYVVLVTLWIAQFYWLFFRNGAEILINQLAFVASEDGEFTPEK